MVPERDSSLYDCFTNSQNQQVYSRFRPLIPAISVPNLSNIRCNSNSSSNEADEESSSSSMNSNQIVQLTNSTEENGIGIYMTPSLSLSTTNMSTFKTTTNNPLPPPSKPSEVKRRSNNRKQIYAAINLNNNSTKIIENETPTAPPPPPPPFPTNFDSIKKVEHQTLSTVPKQVKTESVPATTNDFQLQIEQAKNRLKKIDIETSSKVMLSSTKSNGLIKPTQKNISSNYLHFN